MILKRIQSFTSLFVKIECTEDTIWGIDKDNTVWFKDLANVDEHLKRKYTRDSI